MRQVVKYILFFVLASQVQLKSQQLEIYDIPKKYFYTLHNDDFTVQVKQPGSDWKDLFEYLVEVDMNTRSKASMVFFDFEGKVDIRVQVNNGLVHQVDLRPASLDIQPRVEGRYIYFSLDKPSKLSLEINGDRLHNLHLFANPIEKERPDPNDPHVVYFGPGVHTPEDTIHNTFHIESDKTVYVHGSAILEGELLVDSAQDVKILGRGIVLRGSRGVEIRHSQNVKVDGLIFINPEHYTIFGGEVTGLTVRNIKSFSSQGWSDGIDLMSCSDVVVDDVFMRNSDDCIAIYAHRWEFYGNSRNIEIKNSTLWADVAHPTHIGTHGNAGHEGDTIENITFSNIDILEHDERDRDYQGCLAITCTDKNLIRNVTYENIRIERVQEGMLFNFRVHFNEKYSAAPGRAIQGVTLDNIVYMDGPINPSVIHGYNETQMVEDVLIKDLKIGGKKITRAAAGVVEIGEYTRNIRFE